MSENIENLPSSGSLVFMTGFVSLNEIYIRRSEDYNDEFDKFINTVNNLCSSGKLHVFNFFRFNHNQK
jgi:hypothetical protein